MMVTSSVSHRVSVECHRDMKNKVSEQILTFFYYDTIHIPYNSPI